jgi:hypothetical protein
MSNGDAVNSRRPTQYNVQRRRHQSKKANTVQCPTETPSIQEGKHNTMSNGELDIVLCWPSWIDGVSVGYCIVLAFWIDGVFVGHCIVLAILDWRRLRWTLYCVGHCIVLALHCVGLVLCWPNANTIQYPTETPSIQEGQHNTMSNGETVNPRWPTQCIVQRRRCPCKKAKIMQCPTETPSIQEDQHNTMSNGDAINPRRIVLCWPCIALAFLDWRSLRLT